MTTERIGQVYECPKLKRTVQVTWVEHVHYSSRHGRKEEDSRVFGGTFSCDGETECGVQTAGGSFVWIACPHSKSPTS
jgi:hypothetical protein